MAYIGQSIKNGTFSVLDTSGNTYNGSNVTFSLGTQVGSPAQLLVSHDGVVQKPGTDYTLATGGTQITFTTAPASGASIFIVEISGAVGGPMNTDINGAEFILDVDGDTSITADTDDQIDFKAGGTDTFHIINGKVGVGTSSPDTTLSLEENNAPKIQFKDTSGGSDAKVWRTMGLNDAYLIETRSDDLASGQVAYIIGRSGTTVNQHDFYTSDAVQVRIHSNGVMSAADGVALGVGTASTASNVLDDYEEGDFTATLRGATEPSTKLTTTGKYVKIGRNVNFELGFEAINASSYGGAAYIHGLPFANISGVRNMATFAHFDAITHSGYVVGEIPGGGSEVTLEDVRSNTSWTSALHKGSSGAYYWLTGCYQTN